MKEKIDFLAATLPYSVLPDQVLEELANLVEEVDFPENTRLFDEGSHKVKGVHIIMEGSFETFFLDSQQAKRKVELYGP